MLNGRRQLKDEVGTGSSSAKADWCVYFLRCRNGSFYCGISNRPQERFHAHLQGRGAKYTRMHKPLAMRLVFRHLSKSRAARMEAVLKKLNKEDKRFLWFAAQWPVG